MKRSPTPYLMAAALLVAAGCGKKEAPKPAEPPVAAQPAPAPAPLAVASIDLGKGLDAGKMVTGATTTFGQRDTIYAAVATTGLGSNASLGAKWSYIKKAGGELVVNESSQTITTAGPAQTEFHITKASPWPKGSYKVEVMLNGTPAGSKDFTVQ